MSWQATAWAAERRYGDPLARFVMLTLADTAGMGEAQHLSIERLSERTEITEGVLLDLLGRLTADGHLLSVSFDKDGVTVDLAFRHDDVDSLTRQKCPHRLRSMVISHFHSQCSYCLGHGSYTDGPDGKPWHVDRIEAGGMYEAGNVTLACATCNISKGNRPAKTPVKSLSDVLGQA